MDKERLEVLKAHWKLVFAAVKSSLTPLPSRSRDRFNSKRIESKKKSSIEFANSELLQIWCDCSELFDSRLADYPKLRKKILEINKLNVQKNNNKKNSKESKDF